MTSQDSSNLPKNVIKFKGKTRSERVSKSAICACFYKGMGSDQIAKYLEIKESDVWNEFKRTKDFRDST